MAASATPSESTVAMCRSARQRQVARQVIFTLDILKLKITIAHMEWTNFELGRVRVCLVKWSLLIVLPFGAGSVLAQQPGTLLWSVGMPGEILSPAVGKDGTIYVGSYAISPQGRTNWISPAGGRFRATPAVGADGTVYIGAMNGYLYAIKPGGTTNWATRLGDEVRSSPAIAADGTIYVNAVSNYVERLTALSPGGTRKWTCSMGNAPFPGSAQASSPAIGPEGTIYVGSLSGSLFAIRPDGSTNWMFSLGSVTYCSPAIGADGTIYIGADNGTFRAIDRRGFQKWQFAIGGIIESSPAVANDGTIYVAYLQGPMFALYPNGTKKWSTSLGSVSSSPAIAADGAVYVGSYNSGKMYALSSAGVITQATEAASTFSSPAIGPDGTIYFTTGTALCALAGTNAPQESAWPLFRRDSARNSRSIQCAITGPVVLPGAGVQLTLMVETGRTYRVQATATLREWEDVAVITPTNIAATFIDMNNTNFSRRFYRLACP